MPDLKNKVALITGASGGIGRAIAVRFSQAGARVAVHYHAGLERANATISALAGRGHLAIKADVADPESAAALVAKVCEEMHRIDILVNNAGVFDLHPIADLDYEDWQQAWQRTIGINLLGPAYLSFCAIREMEKQKGGKIINISSRGAFRGEPVAPAYGASKAGMNAMSQSLAKALAHKNIFVYAIAPGFVDTERVGPILHGPDGDGIRKQSPLGRVAKPEEVAHTALFLAQQGTEFLTGCIIDVNGASYLRT